MNRIIGVLVILIGFILFSYSISLDGYTNREEFENRIYDLRDFPDKSEKFYELRNAYLTPKYELENYGLVAMIIGLAIIIILPTKGFNIKIAKEKWVISSIGLAAVAISVIGFVGDLFLEMHRFRYPPWSDSLGIPLMGVPFMAILFLGWWGVNLFGLKGSFALNSELIRFDFSAINYWYFTLTVVTLILTLFLIYVGDFWWTAASFCWAYYYSSIWIGMMNDKIKNANKG